MNSACAITNTTLTVAIAIPQNSNGERTIDYSLDNALGYSVHSPHFHVIISNASDKQQRIWREWCSWGYYALSFEITDQNGKKWIASKKPRGWDKNYPDFWTIEPHESLVLDVEFAETGTWDGFPRSNGTFTIRAVFEVQPDEDSLKHSVWTGRAVSNADKYVFYK